MYKRHIAKTITWRIIGTLDTILLAWLVTGNALTGLKIGRTELFTRLEPKLIYLRRLGKHVCFSATRIGTRNSEAVIKRELMYSCKSLTYYDLGLNLLRNENSLYNR